MNSWQWYDVQNDFLICIDSELIINFLLSYWSIKNNWLDIRGCGNFFENVYFHSHRKLHQVQGCLFWREWHVDDSVIIRCDRYAHFTAWNGRAWCLWMTSLISSTEKSILYESDLPRGTITYEINLYSIR